MPDALSASAGGGTQHTHNGGDREQGPMEADTDAVLALSRLQQAVAVGDVEEVRASAQPAREAAVRSRGTAARGGPTRGAHLRRQTAASGASRRPNKRGPKAR